MARTDGKKKPDRIGDSAVRAKRGKGWNEWFARLDAAGAWLKELLEG
jgi:hypothetical protein